jgi:hypothetical protein
MSIAQGLSSILFQVAWKGQLRILHPSPEHYSAFMGDVQLASGIITCVLMLLAPWLFKRLGWAGTLGMAVHVEHIKTTLKAPGPQCLKLEFDGLLSIFAVKFNWRRYTLGPRPRRASS